MRAVCCAALLGLCLALFAFPAHADESGCRADVVMTSGRARSINQVAGQVGLGEMTTSMLAVTMDGGDELFDISRLRSLTRLNEKRPNIAEYLVLFAFRDRKGRKGKFTIDGDFMLTGDTSDGPWSVAFKNIASVKFTCPKADPDSMGGPGQP